MYIAVNILLISLRFVNTYKKNMRDSPGYNIKSSLKFLRKCAIFILCAYFGGQNMAVTMEFFDGISFDIAKQKYYNANKVDAKMQEIRAAFAGLIEENNELRQQIDDIGLSKARVAELIMSAQERADDIIKDAKAKSEEILKQARLDADGIIISREAEAGVGAMGLTQGQLAAIDKLNKQLDDFNVAQATQIFRIKQALMKIALDK